MNVKNFKRRRTTSGLLNRFMLELRETYAMGFTSDQSYAATANIRPVELRDGGAFAEPRRIRRFAGGD
jgi:hypothetical protein